ncbi:Uncharacterised protein [Serratia rubidaea]|uniref:Uncharacterized protein n=1 Tax=Serratia rubidaea TaxID=61652 RepID=A0A4V6JI71_SERRU|nr:Uncharacterised protein [Serratia rubidaea]
MFFNTNTKFKLLAPRNEDSMTVSGSSGRPGQQDPVEMLGEMEGVLRLAENVLHGSKLSVSHEPKL